MSDHQPRAIIHVDMDAFYASVEERDRPELKGRPVIVGGQGGRGVVAAANYAARRSGVHSAMPVSRARSLCPRATFIAPRMDRYREVSSEVFAVFRSVTPLVEGLSLDEAFLDVTGSLRLLGTREDIGRRIRDRILATTGLQASVGMAHNKFLAKLASDAEKPAGFVSVDPARVHAFLDPMPVGRLWGIGRKTEPRLRRLGILTIGQLRGADPAILHDVLGQRTGHFLDLAAGIDEREVEPRRAEKSISHEVTFDADLVDPVELLAEVQRQCEAVMRRLRAQQLLARTVQLKIRDHRFRTATRSITLRAPTDSTRAAFQAAKGLLARWLESHAHTPVRLVGMGVTGLEEALSDPHARTRTGLDRTVDEITGKFGPETLRRGLAWSRSRKD